MNNVQGPHTSGSEFEKGSGRGLKYFLSRGHQTPSETTGYDAGKSESNDTVGTEPASTAIPKVDQQAPHDELRPLRWLGREVRILRKLNN